MPPSPVFFLDENASGKKLVGALRTAGVQVEIATDHFPRGTPDVEWITKVTQRGWVIVTQDKRIRYRPNEKAALFDAGARVFILGSGNHPHPEIIEGLMKALPKLLRLAVRPGPFLHTVYVNGTVGEVVTLSPKDRSKSETIESDHSDIP